MPRRNFTDSEEEQIARIYLAGHSARAITRAYGLSHHISIVAALRRQGIKQRSPAERNRIYKLNPCAFDKIDSEDAAYWLGFLYADGCVHRRSLQVALKEQDKEQLIKLKAFLKSEALIKHIKVRSSDTNVKKYKQVTFYVTDRNLSERLKALGIIAGRPDHRPMIKETPGELYHHLIRGYFDGDGSARKSPSISFCGSEELLAWIRHIIAQSAGTNPDLKITKHVTANLYYLDLSGRKQALRVAEYLYRDSTVWLARKRDVIDSWPEPQKRQRNREGRWI